MQAAAGAVQLAQLGALRARPLAAPGARRHLLPGGRGASCEGIPRQGFYQASPQQRVSLLSEHLPSQQGEDATQNAKLCGFIRRKTVKFTISSSTSTEHLLKLKTSGFYDFTAAFL